MLISYSKRETKNLGNYENVSIGIKVEDDIDLETETAEEGLKRLKGFVIDNLNIEFGRVSARSSADVELRHLISKLVALDINNKNIIKNMLMKYNVTKVSELNEVDIINFSRELETLKNIKN